MWRWGTWGNHRLRTPSTVRGLLPPPRIPSTVRGLLPPSADSFHRPRTPSTAHGLLPPPRAVPLPRRGRSWGIRRSKPAALPSIGYRGFAVAPMTLRALSRSLVYSPGDERARNARPYGGQRCNRCNEAAQRCKCISPFRFPPRCRGAHRAPADIIQTFDFSPQRPPSLREGDRPVGGGRSSQALEGVRPHRFYAEYPSIFRRTVGIRGTRSI